MRVDLGLEIKFKDHETGETLQAKYLPTGYIYQRKYTLDANTELLAWL